MKEDSSEGERRDLERLGRINSLKREALVMMNLQFLGD